MENSSQIIGGILATLIAFIPFITWGWGLFYMFKTPLEKILDDFKKDSKAKIKWLIIPAFFFGGPVLPVIGIVTFMIRYQKSTGSERARLDTRFKDIKNKAKKVSSHLERKGGLKNATYGLLPGLIKSSEKPTTSSMKAAISAPPGIKQDNGLGRAIMLVVFILIVFGAYYAWKSGVFSIVG